MDSRTGELSYVETVPGIVNPSFLVADADGRNLYAVSEVENPDDQEDSCITAFAINPASGGLKFLNKRPTHGFLSCHLAIDRSGKFVIVANYETGNLAFYPLTKDGGAGEALTVIQHHGRSQYPSLETGPHAHAVKIDRNNRFLYVPDLGMDKVMIYRLDTDSGTLEANDPPFAAVAAGAGPRHFDFSPDNHFAYVINETNSTVTAFAWDEHSGSLDEIQTISTLPSDFSGTNYCADIHVSASGKFLYGSNRGHDSIAIFEVDRGNGKISLIGHESTQGKTPRNFTIDPTGKFLLAANQDSDNIVSFRIDPESGFLKPTGQIVAVPNPVCLEIVPRLLSVDS